MCGLAWTEIRKITTGNSKGYDNVLFSLIRGSFLPAATKLGQGNIFTSVCQEFYPQSGREVVCLSACWDTPPPRSRHPHPWTRHTTTHPPPGADTPRSRHPPRPGTPLGADPPDQAHPLPPRGADCSIRSMSGRYASYWNAFLLTHDKTFTQMGYPYVFRDLWLFCHFTDNFLLLDPRGCSGHAHPSVQLFFSISCSFGGKLPK